jgi:hypothetical protein
MGCARETMIQEHVELASCLLMSFEMKNILVTVSLVSVVIATACKKDNEKAPAPTPSAPAPSAAGPSAPVAPTPDPTPAPVAAPAPGKMVELELAAFGADFKGYTISAPEGAVVEFDAPSRHIKWGESEYLAIDDAPFWEDAVAGLAKDKDNQNIVVSKGIMARWERTPPLGRSWLVDVVVKVGKNKLSCNNGMTGTFTSKEIADLAETMCKSMHKK